MKKVFIFIMIVSCSYSFAQREHHRSHHQKNKKEFFESLSAEELATLKTKKMTLDLDLSENQQNQVYEITLKSVTDKRAKRAERGNENSEKPSEDEKYAKIIERIDDQIAHKNEMKNILNDEQFVKWERHAKRKHAKKRKKRRK